MQNTFFTLQAGAVVLTIAKGDESLASAPFYCHKMKLSHKT
jgi:hypothetical protein